MATEYARLRALIEVADNSSYYKPRFEREFEDLISVTEWSSRVVVTAAGGVTVDLTNYANPLDTIILFNPDSTDTVVATYTYAGTPIDADVGPGRMAIINAVDSTANLVLTASANTPDCWVVVLD